MSLAVVLAVAVVAGVALVDTLRGDGHSAQPLRTQTLSTPTTTATPVFVNPTPAYPRCRRNQLRLVFSNRGRGPIAVLQHVRGPSCQLRPTHVRFSARGPHGEDPFTQYILGPGQDTLAGNFRAGVRLVATPLGYDALCARTRDRGKRFLVRVEAGPYHGHHIVTCPTGY